MFVAIESPLLLIHYFIKLSLGFVKRSLFVLKCPQVQSLSASYVGIRFGVTERTARLFMLKIREAMYSRGNNPMNRIVVHVDEFVLGGREELKPERSYDAKKKKAITTVQLTEEGKVKRMYAIKIDDFSAQSLQYIFINHIDRGAKVITDKWRGYRPIAKAYNIKQ